MALQPIPQGPFIKGIVASNQPLAEPKGAIARGSNLLLNSRGALDVCDGSQILHEFSGAVQSGRGKIMCDFLFQPIGVSSYYLSLQKVIDVHLGAPRNLTVVTAVGGGLPPDTYSYVVTALDGADGESIVSNQVSILTGLNNKNTLTWNIVPNATGYRVYRKTAVGSLALINSPNIPVVQPNSGVLTASFVDDGITSQVATFTITNPVAHGTSKESVAGVSPAQVLISTTIVNNLSTGQIVTSTGVDDPNFDATYEIIGIINPFIFRATTTNPATIGITQGATSGNGTLSTGAPPPIADDTQQTALFKMPVITGSPAVLPVSYDNSNIVALYPADIQILPDGGGGGGSGGKGKTGGGGATGGSGVGGGTSTPGGGILGNVSFTPMFRQFTNRAIIALGNGFPPQAFSDPMTKVNPATTVVITTLVADAFGVVTVTTATPHGLSTILQSGNVFITGVLNPAFNFVGPVIAVPSPTTFKYQSNVVSTSSSGGTVTTTSLPLSNSFIPAYPVWAATENLIQGDVLVPATQPAQAIYLTVIQGGQTGATEPIWPTGGQASVGQRVKDGSIIWEVAGLLNAAAPPPPGAAHIEVYGGALWVWNTSPFNTADGLDGPCCLRMSSINNPNSWNPINQAFLDRDDGQEGMGLAKFTITAQGIPPEGSLIAFKNYIPYQIIGIFGATNFAIQAAASDLGCTAPRTIQFVPGFGIVRYTHLGVAIFNTVKDEVVSEQIRPYLFPNNDLTFADITVVDSTWVSVSWATQTANPPMFVIAMPIGDSGGALTRLFCYDLVFKAWLITDLPFAIATIAQFRTVSANPVTVFGGFDDGCISRWQAGDVLWDVNATGARSPSKVNWSFRSLTAASSSVDQRIYCRKVVIFGTNTRLGDNITVAWRQNGVPAGSLKFLLPTNADFNVDCPIQLTNKRFDATISGDSDAQIDGLSWEVEPRPIGVVTPI